MNTHPNETGELQKLKFTLGDYIRYFPMAVGTVLWERGKKILKWVGAEL